MRWQLGTGQWLQLNLITITIDVILYQIRHLPFIQSLESTWNCYCLPFTMAIAELIELPVLLFTYLNPFCNFAENLESMLNGMRPPLPTGNIKRESSSSSRAGQQNVGGANNSSSVTDLDRSLSPPYTGSSNSNNLVS